MFEILGIILMLVFLEGILSIDNAAVLGAMVAHLPDDKPIPWGGAFKWMQGHGDRLLGMQQQAALKVGLLGAYIGRGLMLGLAFLITENEWVLFFGAAYLFYLGIHHFAELHRHAADAKVGRERRIRTTSFWKTVLIIELIDLAFSLDNVVAAVALDPKRRFWVIALGVAIGIVAMRFAATIFTKLIAWEPNLAHAAFALLIVIGSETVIKALFHVEIAHWLKFVISISVLLLTIGISKVPALLPLKSALGLLMPVADVLERLFQIVILPITWLISLLMMPFRKRIAQTVSIDEP